MRDRSEIKEWVWIAMGGAILATVLLFAQGCAKNVGDEGVRNWAKVTETASYGFVYIGLTALNEYEPQTVNGILEDLTTIREIADMYNDGNATPREVADTALDVFGRVNFYFKVIELQGVNLALAQGALATIAGIVEAHIQETELPEETAIYINALSAGIEQGIEDFQKENNQ